MLKIVDQGIISRDKRQGAYMPSITLLSDGTFIACQHVGKALGSPDNHIEVLHSADKGHTWINKGSIHAGTLPDGWAYRHPRITEMPDGRLVLTATRFEFKEGALFDPISEGIYSEQMLLFWSEDHGYTWSAPEVITVDLSTDKYCYCGSCRVVALSPDRWMYPLETWKPAEYIGRPDQKAAAVFSTDHGKTWGELTVLADDRTGKMLYWDQECTVLPDGRIYALFWTREYGMVEDSNSSWVISSDEGRSWSEPRSTNFRSQACAPITLGDGRVAAIYAYRQDPQGIRVALSEDLSNYDLKNEMVVFDAQAEIVLPVTEDAEFCAVGNVDVMFGRPGGILLPDKDILVFFWCTSEGITHNRWVRLRV